MELACDTKSLVQNSPARSKKSRRILFCFVPGVCLVQDYVYLCGPEHCVKCLLTYKYILQYKGYT
jgi:hypothetical protein